MHAIIDADTGNPAAPEIQNWEIQYGSGYFSPMFLSLLMLSLGMLFYDTAVQVIMSDILFRNFDATKRSFSLHSMTHSDQYDNSSKI